MLRPLHKRGRIGRLVFAWPEFDFDVVRAGRAVWEAPRRIREARHGVDQVVHGVGDFVRGVGDLVGGSR